MCSTCVSLRIALRLQQSTDSSLLLVDDEVTSQQVSVLEVLSTRDTTSLHTVPRRTCERLPSRDKVSVCVWGGGRVVKLRRKGAWGGG